MRTEIYQWMKNLAFFHVLTTAIVHILPDKRYEQYIRLFMGLLLVLLICMPVFSIVGKSEEILESFRKDYEREEQVRMETEAEEIRESFLDDACKNELKRQIHEILRENTMADAETEVELEPDLLVTIKISGAVKEKQKEAVRNGLERICGLREEQYQILYTGDGMEGVGNPSAAGSSSSGGGISGIPQKQ